jgi:hypothetical protein
MACRATLPLAPVSAAARGKLRLLPIRQLLRRSNRKDIPVPFLHRDYARRSNVCIPVGLHAQRILEFEVVKVRICSDDNLASPDAGRENIDVGPAIWICISSSPDRIWNRGSYDTDVDIH